MDGEVAQHVEYFPFGETFLEEHSNTDRTPYLFNGKELDEETQLYYYGARYYDPVTSVWQSVDPMAEQMPNWSPYVFSFNNPIAYIDPDGRIPYPITIRSFAPFKSFGFGFHGDNRGFSTDQYVSARVQQRINFDTDKTYINTGAWSSSTYKTSNPNNKKTGVPSVTLNGKGGSKPYAEDNLTIRSSGDTREFNFESSYAGGNPLTPKAFTPDINVFSEFSIIENKKAGTLDITGKLTGDNFPSTEAFISDPSGQSVFLGIGQIDKGVGKNTGPITELPGENKDRSITNFNISILTGKGGNFTGVKYKGNTYSVKDWNKQFTSKSPQKQ